MHESINQSIEKLINKEEHVAKEKFKLFGRVVHDRY